MSSSGDGEFGDDGGAAVAGAVAQAATVLKADEWEDTISVRSTFFFLFVCRGWVWKVVSGRRALPAMHT